MAAVALLSATRYLFRLSPSYWGDWLTLHLEADTSTNSSVRSLRLVFLPHPDWHHSLHPAFLCPNMPQQHIPRILNCGLSLKGASQQGDQIPPLHRGGRDVLLAG